MAVDQPCSMHESAYTNNLLVILEYRYVVVCPDSMKRIEWPLVYTCSPIFVLSLSLHVGDYLYIVKILHAKDFPSSLISSFVNMANCTGFSSHKYFISSIVVVIRCLNVDRRKRLIICNLSLLLR